MDAVNISFQPPLQEQGPSAAANRRAPSLFAKLRLCAAMAKPSNQRYRCKDVNRYTAQQSALCFCAALAEQAIHCKGVSLALIA